MVDVIHILKNLTSPEKSSAVFTQSMFSAEFDARMQEMVFPGF